jgi:hypothetical protein
VSLQPGRGPAVIDTDVYGAELDPGSRLKELYQAIIVGRRAFISFQTVAVDYETPTVFGTGLRMHLEVIA